MRTPNEAEIRHTAQELGYHHWPLTPREYTKVAKTLEVAVHMEAAEQAQPTAGDFTNTITTTYTNLTQAGLTDDAAARIVAAIAPDVWRTTQGAAHAS